MRILIIGAGKVGSSVAGNLVSESNDITIVDTNKAKIAEIQSNYDLQGIVGDATSPSVLADAGAVDADMIIAVTANDETNLAVTLIAEQLFNVPSRIARVRNDELREYPALLSTSGFRATSVIWPEEAITNYIVQLITYPEALQVIEFSDGDVVLMSVKIVSSSKMCGRPVSALQDERRGSRFKSFPFIVRSTGWMISTGRRFLRPETKFSSLQRKPVRMPS